MKMKKVAMSAFAGLALSLAVSAVARDLKPGETLWNGGYLNKLQKESCENGSSAWKYGEGEAGVKKCKDETAEYNAISDARGSGIGSTGGGHVGDGWNAAYCSGPGRHHPECQMHGY